MTVDSDDESSRDSGIGSDTAAPCSPSQLFSSPVNRRLDFAACLSSSPANTVRQPHSSLSISNAFEGRSREFLSTGGGPKHTAYTFFTATLAINQGDRGVGNHST